MARHEFGDPGRGLPVQPRGAAQHGRRGGGTVVNLGGVSAHVGAKRRAHVATAKAGLGRSDQVDLAVEFADRNITVNCVAPGKIGGKRSATSGASPEMGTGWSDRRA
jgi:3-oxoacyl-[acyl-carrier protein] reductase